MYQICNENTIYETANDEPETKIWNMRADLFEKTKENIRLNTGCITQLEFERYYNCDTDGKGE